MKTQFKRILFGYVLRIGVLLAFAATAKGQGPAWWDTNNVTTTDPPSNMSPVNLGQLKHMAQQAAVELNTHLPGGAGDGANGINQTILAWVANKDSVNQHAVVNLGQLKHVASLFYDRLIEEQYADRYPWTNSLGDDDNFAVANIGQLKNLFNFDVEADSDGDGLKDMWEINFFGSIDTQDETSDSDGDGILDITEQGNKSNPLVHEAYNYRNIFSDMDMLPDWWERLYFGNLDQEAGDDPDRDGIDNMAEYNASWTGAVGTSTFTGASNPNDPDESLVAYWQFEEGYGTIAGDAGTNGSSGILNGAVWQAPGGIGSGSLSFDGSASVTVPREVLHGRTQLAVAFWMKSAAGSQLAQTVINGAENNANDAEFAIIARNTSPSDTIRVHWSDFSGGFHDFTTTNRAIFDGAWHHLVVLIGEGARGREPCALC